LKALITGGAGFIGSNFVRRVLDGTLQGISEITVLDKLTYAGSITNFSADQLSSFEFVQGDICDADLVGKLSKTTDVIINFAAESHVDRSIAGSREFFVTNVLGTHTLAQAAQVNGVDIFLQVSTDEVYGSLETGSWTEAEPLLPNSPYAASKAAADLLIRSFVKTHSIDMRVTRCSNNYGIHQFPEKVIPTFITKLLRSQKVPLYGNGKNIRDWLHVDDHCRAINLVLNKGSAGCVYNIGGGEELTNLDLAHRVIFQLEKEQSEIEYVPDRKGHDFRYSVDASKIRNELGFQPEISFNQGIAEVINWYKENPQWWLPKLSAIN
jgi:dTDP-glucose 4,6-dehydratase